LPINVRSATSNDVSAIASVTAQMQELHVRSYPTLFKAGVSTRELEDAARHHLGDNNQRVLVAVRDSLVVGYARLEVQRRPDTVVKFARAELYIHEFGVDHEARASGVGSAVIAHIADVARAEGIHRIGVDVFARNEEARLFYESRGFKVEREVRWLIPSAQGLADAPVR